MKKHFRILSLCLALLMLAAVFAGCSKDGTKDKANFKVAFVCSAAGQNDTGYNK